MKKLILLLAFIAISSVSFTSCEKEEVAPTPAELLTAEIWTGLTASFDVAGYPSQEKDISNFSLEFLADGTVKLYNEGEFQGAGTWSLSADGETLHLDLDEEIVIDYVGFSLNDLTVDTLTETELVFSGSETITFYGQEVVAAYTASFSHE